MHYTRILSIVGVLLAGWGFLVTSATSAGEAVMEQLNQLNPAIPTGFDNIWTALYDDTAWAAVAYGIAAVVVFILAVLPPLREPMAKALSAVAAVLGVAMLAIGAFATMGAMDDASDLEDGFAQAFGLGAIPEAYTVSISYGWWLLVAGGAVVAIAGIASLVAKRGASAANPTAEVAG
jgi:hypothetical protein